MQSETGRTTRSLYKDRSAVSLYIAIIALLGLWTWGKLYFLGTILLWIACVLITYVAMRPIAAPKPNVLKGLRLTTIGLIIALLLLYALIAVFAMGVG